MTQFEKVSTKDDRRFQISFVKRIDGRSTV